MQSFSLQAALIGVLLLPLAAHATPVSGSEAISLINVSITPAGASLYPISGVNSLAYTFGAVSGTGFGDFSAIPVGTVVSGATLYPAGVDGGDGTTPFSFSIDGDGTFTETSNPSELSSGVDGNSTGSNLYLLGTFVPSGLLAGFTANAASFDVSFTQTGGSYSGSGTLQVPPSGDALPVPPISGTPEPTSLTLLGTGLVGGAILLRKRLAA